MTGPLDRAKPEDWQERTLSYDSRFRIYRRYFTGQALAEELGGGQILFESRLLVVVTA